MFTPLRCLLLASLVLGCQGARILAMLPTPSRSHMIAFEALTRELAARGHQVTVVSMFPQEKPLPNYTDIVLPQSKFGFEELDMFKMRDVNPLFMIKTFGQMGSRTCEHVLGNPDVQKLMNGPDDTFDLLIMSIFCNECVLGFAHKFNVPTIGIAPMGGLHSMLDIVGNPSPYSYIPHPMLGYSDRMTFTQRLINTLSVSAQTLGKRFMSIPAQDAVMRKYFNTSRPLPHVSELESETALLLLNTHVSLSYPRPYLPNVVEVGGMHIKPGAKKLSADLKRYLDEATDGVIYFSMGSNLKSTSLSAETRQAFLDAFSKLKQRVLWKWEEDTLPGQPKNVMLGKWLPQSPILEHPNVRVFITHGGLLSMQESVYYGVPMVGIPIFGDQEQNAKRAVDLGIGVKVDYENITSEALKWALNTVLSEPSYRENVERLSARFRDQPMTPLETAVYWTEFIIRHKGAPHLRSAALDLYWYQYFLLDVLAVLLLGAVLVGLVFYTICKAVISLLCGGKLKPSNKRKTQ